MKRFFGLFLFVLTIIVMGSCTSVASEPTKRIIKPGDKIGEMTIVKESSKHYYWLLNACKFDWNIIAPHSQTVECTIPELAVVGVGDYWGAVETKFESNWEAMSWELYIDDYQIALDDFGWDEIKSSDSGRNLIFRHWNVIIKDLSAGEHTIRTSWSVETSIDDGYDIYPPGKYEYIANLTVTEKPVYPSMSAVATPGQHPYTSQSANLDFLLYLPDAYGNDPEIKWPLIVYLHDAELRGITPDIISGEALPKKLKNQKNFPFIVLSPVGNGEWDFWSKNEMINPFFILLEEVQSSYAVDENRIYLTGAGMGGNGVWVMGLTHPEYFAALAPLGGYFYPFEVPENICDLKDVPVWAFHGEIDFMVPVEVEQRLVDALIACGGNAQMTVKPNVVIPLETYEDPALFDWFLSQSRK